MVIVCNKEYSCHNTDYNKYFDEFKFKLSDFQKFAIKGIVENSNVLITAHTGSGKTLPAEFAIDYFTSLGKKVIYTSPIKALSNQKFHEFTIKFPNISIGILTGDIKYNPDADVLIMTTEILCNTLFQNRINKLNNSYEEIISFKMDIENELACVIFDEIHYINDKSRGKVWEETIMQLPKQVQMVMLSATINHAKEFAEWIEKINPSKKTFLIETSHRVVPLFHYLYTYVPDSIVKKIKDAEIKSKFMNNTNKFITIKSKDIPFKEKEYQIQKSILGHIKQNYNNINRSGVLNNLVHDLKQKKMLPAICFVFSRNKLEQCAREISLSLFNEDEETYPQVIEKECEKILRKIPNYKEYLNLPEYNFMVKLLEKGIAIHHSGIMPILREMVEILFSKGFIKLLFATETFAVGINMPTKTVIFTSIEKYDGEHFRLLYAHEYTQMAGRAGRRGLDTVGHVIHCNNLFNLPSYSEYKNMLSGNSQTIVSKFKISFNFLLKQINNNNNEFLTEIKKSMIQNEINNEIKQLEYNINELKNIIKSDYEKVGLLQTPLSVLQEYYELKNSLHLLANKQRKRANNDLKNIESEHRFILKDIIVYDVLKENQQSLEKEKNYLNNTLHYLSVQIDNTLEILKQNTFIIDETNFNITERGIVSLNINEIHDLAFTELLMESSYFNEYSSKELVGLFSCFSNITCNEENTYNINNNKPYDLINELKNKLNKYQDLENKYQIESGNDYFMHSFIVEEVMRWCDIDNEVECKKHIYEMQCKKEIFLGEFIKALLKINNIANELEKICLLNNNIGLLHKIREIPKMTLKFVASNQSLYI